MRGKARKRPTGKRLEGITPAYAGKSRPHVQVGLRFGDHPRLCGEKPVSLQLPHDSLRITPAYAGKRNSTNFNRRFCKDHPRLCGEK